MTTYSEDVVIRVNKQGRISFSANQRICLHLDSKPIRMRKCRNL